MTSSGAGKQTQQPLFTVIITHHHTACSSATSQHAPLTPLSIVRPYCTQCLLCPLLPPAHGWVCYWMLISSNYIKSLDKSGKRAIIMGHFLVPLPTHNVLIVHRGPVYRMAAVVVILVAPKEPVVKPRGSLCNDRNNIHIPKVALISVWKHF